jgi:hypothetical protein
MARGLALRDNAGGECGENLRKGLRPEGLSYSGGARAEAHTYRLETRGLWRGGWGKNYGWSAGRTLQKRRPGALGRNSGQAELQDRRDCADMGCSRAARLRRQERSPQGLKPNSSLARNVGPFEAQGKPEAPTP